MVLVVNFLLSLGDDHMIGPFLHGAVLYTTLSFQNPTDVTNYVLLFSSEYAKKRYTA